MARILFIREWYYPVDTRVSREIEALVRAGHEVDLICAGWPGQPHFERGERLRVYRLPIARRRGGMLRYLYEWTMFQIAATALAGALHLRRRYALVQVNSLPDWLVFAAIVPRLLGAKVILDLHECMPEYAATKYQLKHHHPFVRLLRTVEQAAIRFADSVITCTDQMRQRFVERGAPRDKIAVVLNAFDEDRFDPRRYVAPHEDGDRFVLVCHGTIDENYGLDIAIRAVEILKDVIPSVLLRIYGNGTHRASLQKLVGELGLEEHVWFSDGFLPIEELLPRIAAADVGVVAVKRDAFRDLTHCNKMYDLVAMRKPVVIARTTAVEAYFGDDAFQLFESGNERDLARAIRELYEDPALRDRLVDRATAVGEPYRWPHQRRRYVGVVDQLVGSDRATALGAPVAQVVDAIALGSAQMNSNGEE